MNRRQLMLSASGIGAAIAIPGLAVAAAESKAHVHPVVDKALLDAAFQCVKVAEVCQAHCQMLLSTGDTMLKDCSRSVAQLLPVCDTLASLAAQGSKFLPQYAKLALEFCNDCEKECRKHEQHHVQCKECADACAACAKECKRIAG